MEIETRSASLETLSVTIQALHVSGKQMTLAVFRQLPVTHAYNDDGSLRPMEYWGIVRYAIKDEGDAWVVCASGGRLYRCPLKWHVNNNVWFATQELAHAKASLAWWHRVKARVDRGGSVYVYDEDDDEPRGCHVWRVDDLAALEGKVAESETCLQTCQRAEETRAKLLRIPQLFIAV